jgi:hypothetical protein
MCWKCCFGSCSCNTADDEGARASAAIDRQIKEEKARYKSGKVLKPEGKTDWEEGLATGKQRFIHCSNITPYDIRQCRGLDPSKGKESVYWGENDSKRGQYLFAFGFEGGKVKPPPQSKFLGFSAGGFIYVFKLPRNTRFLTKKGVVKHGAEVGIIELVPMAVIQAYTWNDGDDEGTPIDLETWQPGKGDNRGIVVRSRSSSEGSLSESL